MVSTRQSSRAEQVASNAQARADGGFIFADARNAVTSAAAIVHQVSMHRNITPRRVTRLSRVSSRASGGFTTIAQKNPSPARSFPLLTRIRWNSRRPDRPERCLQTGKRCFTNRERLFGSAASQAVRSRRSAQYSSDWRERPLCLSMIFSENRFPPSDQVRGQAFSGSCSRHSNSRTSSFNSFQMRE
jgi:hypothetical protein